MREVGIYLRAESNDGWQNVDLLELTEDELRTILQGKGVAWRLSLIVQLCELLRDNNDPDCFKFQDGTTLEYRQERID